MTASWNLRLAHLLLLVSTAAAAEEPEREGSRPGDDLWWRTAEMTQRPAYIGSLSFRLLDVPADPRRSPRYIYVAGGVPTTLRFTEPVDPQGTTLEGMAGRFEPLVVNGKYVIVCPLRDLEPGATFILAVRLMSGVEIPLTVSSGSGVDGAVKFIPDNGTVEAMRYTLAKQTNEIARLQAQYQQEQEQSTSVDHALATLLAKGQEDMTPFKVEAKWQVRERNAHVFATVYAPKDNSPTDFSGKTAVVFKVKNKNVVPWDFQEARLTLAGTEAERPFALRATSRSIAPGETGAFAVVMDFGSHDKKKSEERFLLELFQADGYRQAFVVLAPAELFH